MSNALGVVLLSGDRVLVPFEMIAGTRQVSSFVVISGDNRQVFSLAENEKDVGPVKVNRLDLSYDKIDAWLNQHKSDCEEISPKDVRVTESSFRYDGGVETIIYAVDLIEADGRTLRMSREGAAYPYTLALTGFLDAVLSCRSPSPRS